MGSIVCPPPDSLLCCTDLVPDEGDASGPEATDAFTVRLNVGEDDDADEGPPPEAAESDEPPPSDEERAAPDDAVAAVPDAAPVTMQAAENYESMDDNQKACYEKYVRSQLDSSLVNYYTLMLRENIVVIIIIW